MSVFHADDPLDALVLDVLRPLEPSAQARARFFGATEGAHRYAPFTERVAELFAIDELEAAETLRGLADETRWMKGPVPGIFLAPAPHRLGNAMAMFIRGRAGAKFPLHRHHGEERVLVMEGVFRETDGTEFHPGDLAIMSDGSSHAFSIPEGADCVSAYVIAGGIELAS